MTISINPGDYQHRVTIEKSTATADSYGQENLAWVAHCTVWAKVKPLIGKEYFAARQTVTAATHKVTLLQYVSGISPADRIRFGERYFNIESIIDVDEMKMEMVLICRELGV